MRLEKSATAAGAHPIAPRPNELRVISPPPATRTAARLPLGMGLRRWLLGALGLRRTAATRQQAPPKRPIAATARRDWARTWDVRELEREAHRRAVG